MSVPFVAHAFKAGDNLDLEKLNDALESISRHTLRSLDARYTYSTIELDLTGVVTADAAVLRRIGIRRPGTDNAVEVYAVELVLYGNAAGTASVACSDTTWPTMSVTTSATTTEEVSGSSGVPVSIPSSASSVNFTVTLPAAYTVTAGQLVVHLRCDRRNQGTLFTPTFPALLTSATAAPGTTLDAELAALETAVAADTTMAVDVRCECYAVRGLGAGSSVTWSVPSGARKILGLTAFNVQAIGGTATFSVASASTATQSVAALPGGGATVVVASAAVIAGDVTMVDDPMDSTDDLTVTITAATLTVVLGYVLVWWS
jgi:hypothetical protein